LGLDLDLVSSGGNFLKVKDRQILVLSATMSLACRLEFHDVFIEGFFWPVFCVCIDNGVRG